MDSHLKFRNFEHQPFMNVSGFKALDSALGGARVSCARSHTKRRSLIRKGGLSYENAVGLARARAAIHIRQKRGFASVAGCVCLSSKISMLLLLVMRTLPSSSIQGVFDDGSVVILTMKRPDNVSSREGEIETMRHA